MKNDPFTFRYGGDYFGDYSRKLFENMMRETQTNAGASYYENVRPPAPGEKNITTKKPRDGYIDAGVIMTKGWTITRVEMENMEKSEWNIMLDWIDAMDNIVVEEMVDRQMLWVYDKIPCITSVTN